MARGLRIIQGDQPGAVVRDAITEILDARDLLCLATSTPTTGPHASTLYFAHDAFVVWFVSESPTEHGRQAEANPRASAAVFLEPAAYAEGLRGVQLGGTIRVARPKEADEGLAVYRARFPEYAPDQAPDVLYRFEVDAVTLLDEPRFGRRSVIRALVVR
jgi:uncharacterized protein YhbP (UPF0306 family)